MPYRDALETTLARCTALQVRGRALSRELGLPWRPPAEIRAPDIDEADALERTLEAHVADLEEERAQRAVAESAVIAPANHATASATALHVDDFTWRRVVIGTAIAFAALFAFVAVVRSLESRRVQHTHFRAAGHTHSWSEHCSVDVDRVNGTCDVDVKCVTFARHMHSDPCSAIEQPSAANTPYVSGVIEARVVHTQNDDGAPVDVELE